MANLIPDRIFNLAFEEYISENNVVIEDSRILQDFNNEVSTQKEYRGREIFELIQNADDQTASKMVIKLDTKNHILTVSNDGDKPFTEAGFRSIMRANNSSKPLENLIGQKGLGFRSILNWAKEIEIHSAGVVCKFSSGIADRKWGQIKKAYLAKLSETVDYDIHKALKYYEAIAAKENRKSPLAILAVPDLLEGSYTDEDENYAATIKIVYSQGVNGEIERGIKNQLESLKDGRALLFLPNLKSLSIIEDEEKTIVSKSIIDDTVTLAMESSLVKTEKKWLITGEENDAGYYDVAIAYPLDGGEIVDNTFYCFFPTKESNPFHCVVHAAFWLEQSRNYFIEENANSGLIDRCATKMLELAEDDRIGKPENQWAKLGVVYTDNDVSGLYQKQLEAQLMNGLFRKAVFPTVGNRNYMEGGKVHFVSSSLSDVVSEILRRIDGQPLCFYDMLYTPLSDGYLNKLIKRGDVIKEYDESYLVRELNVLSEMGFSMDLRARLIQSVVTSRPDGFVTEKPALLVDEKGAIIHGYGYLISSDKIPVIPDGVDMVYVSKELFEQMKLAFSIVSFADNPAERQLQDRLKSHLNVRYADKNTVVRTIAPTNKDLSIGEIMSRVRSLFDYYRDYDKNRTDALVLNNIPVYLPNRNNEIMESTRLTLFDDVYPDGLQRLGIASDSKRYHLLDWESWAFDCQDMSDSDVQSFWRALNVSLYIPEVRHSLKAEDKDYFNLLGIIDDGSTEFNLGKYLSVDNIVLVPEKDFADSLSIADFITLVLKDRDLFNRIIGGQRLYYSYFGQRSKDFYTISYIAFYIKKNLAIVKQLSDYVDIGVPLANRNGLSIEKIKDRFVDGCIDINKDYHRLLVELGAVDTLEELTTKQLYGVLNEMSKDPRFQGGIGVSRIYERIKRVLAERQDAIPPEELVLYAKKTDGTEAGYYVHDEVYYWDNDRLPQWMTKDHLKLALHGRAGEKTVNKVFGVKLLDDLSKSISIIVGIRHQPFENNLVAHLKERGPYIDAIRKEKNGQGEKISALLEKNDRIRCYTRCVCSYGGGHDYELNENEIVTTFEEGNRIYHIEHSANESVASAIRNPAFCDTVLEVLAMFYGLKTESSEALAKIRNVLIYSIPEIQYYYPDVVEDSVRNAELKNAGIGGTISKQAGFYALIELRNQCVRGFQIKLKEYLDGDIDKQGLFVSLCRQYQMNDWLDFETADDNRDQFFLDKIKDKFHVEINSIEALRGGQGNLTYCEDYYKYCQRKTLKDIGRALSPEIESLLFFSGHDEEVRPYLQALSGNDASGHYDHLAQLDGIDSTPGEAKWNGFLPGGRTNGNWESESLDPKPKHEMSDAQRIKAGEDAEWIALRALQKDTASYRGATGVSRTLVGESGNDSLGYDIEYYETGSDQKRYLEVKSLKGSSCTLTRNEHDKGVSEAKQYDIGFVDKGKLRILKAPFDSDEYNKYIIPTEYVIYKKSLSFLDKESGSEGTVLNMGDVSGDN